MMRTTLILARSVTVGVEAVWKVDLGGYFATLARMRKRYPTDLSDAEWKYIEPHMPAPKGFG
jgi:hypothetical protein